MKLLSIFVLSVLTVGRPLNAATKLFLRSTPAGTSGLGVNLSAGSIGYGCANLTGDWTTRIANTTAGAAVTSISATPTSTAPPCPIWGSAYFVYVTAPLSSGVTISGNIDFNISCSESATQLNAGMRIIVKRWDTRDGGIKETVITSADTLECNDTRRAIAAAAPTSTVFNAGDRLLFFVEVRNVGGGWGGNGSRTVALKMEGPDGTLGDTFANFADTLSFAADTNNWPSRGITQ